MASWRATAPQQVQEDLDALVARALNTAVAHLAAREPWSPFAVVLGLGGEMDLATAAPDEHADQGAVLDRLRTGLTGRAGELRALALVSLAAGTSAEPAGSGFTGSELTGSVLVEAEHREGGPGLQVLTPYRRRRWRRGQVGLGAMHAEPVPRRIW